MGATMNGADPEAMGARIAAIGGWRGEMLAHLRGLIREALPDVIETMT